MSHFTTCGINGGFGCSCVEISNHYRECLSVNGAACACGEINAIEEREVEKRETGNDRPTTLIERLASLTGLTTLKKETK